MPKRCRLKPPFLPSLIACSARLVGGLVICGLLLGCSSRERVVISEFVAANGNGLTDGDGHTSDWIELFNAESAPVKLAGWCLTDDPRTLDRWCFPDGASIPAQGYLVVFASGKRRTAIDTELHSSFKLKSSADYLGLVRPRGGVASEFSYPDQKQDVSFGLSSTGTIGFLKKPTPGAANEDVAPGKPAAR